MADNPAKHEFVDDYPYLAYASEVDTVAGSDEGGESYTLPTASADTLGGVKVGSGLAIDNNGVLSSSGESYTLPTASADTLGGVKVGSGLAIDNNGVLSSSGGGSEQNVFLVSYSIDQETTLPVFTKSCSELNSAIEAGSKILLQGDLPTEYSYDISLTSEMIEHYAYEDGEVTYYGYVFSLFGSVIKFEGNSERYPTIPR